MPRSLLKLNRHFGGTCHLHLQSRTKSQATNQHEACSKHSSAYVVEFQQTAQHYIPEDRTVQSLTHFVGDKCFATRETVHFDNVKVQDSCHLECDDV
jgi:hypothetical protein